MLTLQLYVEGKEVELFKDESITLNQGIQEIRDMIHINNIYYYLSPLKIFLIIVGLIFNLFIINPIIISS